MSAKDGVFRKVSLERLSSPEQLDQRLTVVSPKGVLALVVLFSLVAIAVLWGFLGRISEKVQGQGILLFGEGISSVVSPVTGMVSDLSVRNGDLVETGQIIAHVYQPEILMKIESLQDNLAALGGINRNGTIDISKVNNYEVYSRFIDMARRARIEGGEAVLHLEESINVYRTDLEVNIAKLKDDLAKNSIIMASASGTVISLDFSNGDYVSTGQTIATIARERIAGGTVVSNNVILVTYVPIAYGKKIKEGMEVDVTPSTVNREEYGYMLGHVTSVWDYPATRESMMVSLRNLSLVETFLQNGAVLEVQIELLRSPTISGYRWSTPNGAPYAINPGTLCSSDFRVSTSRPIEIALTFLKSLFRSYGL